MAKNKLFKFNEIAKMQHVLEPTIEMISKKEVDYKGKWNSIYFKNNLPLVLELGCGKGEYTVGLARKYPKNNFIGVDIKGNRIYVGAKQAEDEALENVMFLRAKVEFIDYFFEKDEVSEIWLTFSDPQSKKPNKRLTSTIFINRYRKILKPGGIIHLKTDSDVLFEFTENEIREQGYDCLFSTWDLYGNLDQLSEDEQEILQFKTHYEELFARKGAQIKYCKFKVS